MFSEEIEVGEFYYAITSGEFIGTYYVVKKNSSFYTVISRMRPSEKWDIDYYSFESYDWGEDDDEYPNETWQAESQHISYVKFERRWQKEIQEYFKSFIPHIFTKELP